MNVQSHRDRWSNYLITASFLLILLMIAISPFLNRITVIEPGPLEKLLTNQPLMFDVFSKFKGSVLVAVSCVEALLLLTLIFMRRMLQQETIFTALLIAFMGFTAVSLLFSELQPVAMYGTLDRYEGALVWLSYMVSMLLAAQATRDKPVWKYVKTALMFVLAGQTVLGISQYLGVNLLDTVLFRYFIVPPDIASVYKIGGMNSGNMVYGTMNNSNFYSQAMALLLIIHFPHLSTRKMPSISDIIYMTGVSALVFAGCSGGLIAFGAGVFICSVYSEWSYKDIIGQLIKLAFPIVLAIVVGISTGRALSQKDIVLCIAILLMPLLAEGVKKVSVQRSKYSFGVISGGLLVAVLLVFSIWAAIPNMDGQTVHKISSENERMVIETQMEQLVLTHDKENKIFISDNTGRPLAEPISEGTVTLVQSGEQVTVGGEPALRTISFHNSKVQFLLSKGRFWGTDSRYQGIEIPLHTPQVGFVGKEAFGSGRGFIWSRSIPILKETLIWGIGPDVFPYRFPQDDIVGKINMGAPNILVDKPHNWYLQVAIGTGCLSLFTLIAILLHIMIKAVPMITVSEDENIKRMAVGIVGFITVYMVSGLFYDSIISVSIWVWPVLGTMHGFLNSNMNGRGLKNLIK